MKKYLFLLTVIPCFCFGQVKVILIKGTTEPLVIDISNYSKIDTIISKDSDTSYFIKEIGWFKEVFTLESIFKTDTIYLSSDTLYSRTDTNSVLLLICDTSKVALKGSEHWKYYESDPVHWIRGYKAVVYTNFNYSYKYLDAYKKELPKSIIVWQVKEIE